MKGTRGRPWESRLFLCAIESSGRTGSWRMVWGWLLRRKTDERMVAESDPMCLLGGPPWDAADRGTEGDWTGPNSDRRRETRGQWRPLQLMTEKKEKDEHSPAYLKPDKNKHTTTMLISLKPCLPGPCRERCDKCRPPLQKSRWSDECTANQHIPHSEDLQSQHQQSER